MSTAGTAAAPTPRPAPAIAYRPWVRLLGCAAGGIALFFLLPRSFSPTLRVIFGWDCGTIAMIAWVFVMMARSTPDIMRRRAALQDPGRSAILVVIVAGALFSIVALTFLQKALKTVQGDAAVLYFAAIVATILLSWFLVHVMFSLHYAHGYYGPSEDEDDEDGLVGGLEFPDEKQPDYWDFMYFAFVVGMTCQVSDVQISDRGLRRLALMHGIVSFFFNTIILALTINIVAGII